MINTFLVKETLVPTKGYMQRNQAMNVYKKFTRVLKDHLIKKETLNKQSSPRTYNCLIKKLDKDGFDILTKIIIKGSQQLGRDARNLADYVKELKI